MSPTSSSGRRLHSRRTPDQSTSTLLRNATESQRKQPTQSLPTESMKSPLDTLTREFLSIPFPTTSERFWSRVVTRQHETALSPTPNPLTGNELSIPTLCKKAAYLWLRRLIVGLIYRAMTAEQSLYARYPSLTSEINKYLLGYIPPEAKPGTTSAQSDR